MSLPNDGLFGVWRGIVVDIDDPQKRGRARVFVIGLDRFYDKDGKPTVLTPDKFLDELKDGGNTLPTDKKQRDELLSKWTAYPWAEQVGPYGGRKEIGDVPPVFIGDGVWVMFEGGNRSDPCKIGRAHV